MSNVSNLVNMFEAGGPDALRISQTTLDPVPMSERKMISTLAVEQPSVRHSLASSATFARQSNHNDTSMNKSSMSISLN